MENILELSNRALALNNNTFDISYNSLLSNICSCVYYGDCDIQEVKDVVDKYDIIDQKHTYDDGLNFFSCVLVNKEDNSDAYMLNFYFSSMDGYYLPNSSIEFCYKVIPVSVITTVYQKK